MLAIYPDMKSDTSDSESEDEVSAEASQSANMSDTPSVSMSIISDTIHTTPMEASYRVADKVMASLKRANEDHQRPSTSTGGFTVPASQSAVPLSDLLDITAGIIEKNLEADTVHSSWIEDDEFVVNITDDEFSDEDDQLMNY